MVTGPQRGAVSVFYLRVWVSGQCFHLVYYVVPFQYRPNEHALRQDVVTARIARAGRGQDQGYKRTLDGYSVMVS